MVKLPEEVKIAIDKAATSCIATADNNAVSNVVYVTYLKYLDDETIVIADNQFHKTRANIDNNPQLSCVVLDSDTRKAYQIKGMVKIFSEGEEYQSAVEWVHINHPHLTPKAAVYLQVEEVYCGSERIA